MNRETLFCRVRKEWVVATPEEKVRQYVLSYMLDSLGYPAALLTVELPLNRLPHLRGGEIPDRRLDILSFFKKGEELLPLIVIECKALPLKPAMFSQVAGYNHYIGAPFIALVNHQQAETRWANNTAPFIPSYPDLLKSFS